MEQINVEHRHGYGTEKLPIEQIIAKLPPFITPEVSHLTVFRANGDNRPFLVLEKIIYSILFL